MNNEIKEMLEQMESIAISGKDKNGIKVDGFGLQQKELKILLDYITNLQQELKSANESITWWTNRFKAVQQENERLKEHNRWLEDKIETYFDNVNMQNDLMIEQLDYKSRCEKAIEILKLCNSKCAKETINILQNGSDSQ